MYIILAILAWVFLKKIILKIIEFKLYIIILFILVFILIYFKFEPVVNWKVAKRVRQDIPIQIIIGPSLPQLEVNLIPHDTCINDTNFIRNISNILNQYSVFSLSAKGRIWEARMILIFRNEDSVFLNIKTTDFSGTIVNDGKSTVNVKSLRKFLERWCLYTKPVYGNIVN